MKRTRAQMGQLLKTFNKEIGSSLTHALEGSNNPKSKRVAKVGKKKMKGLVIRKKREDEERRTERLLEQLREEDRILQQQLLQDLQEEEEDAPDGKVCEDGQRSSGGGAGGEMEEQHEAGPSHPEKQKKQPAIKEKTMREVVDKVRRMRQLEMEKAIEKGDRRLLSLPTPDPPSLPVLSPEILEQTLGTFEVEDIEMPEDMPDLLRDL